MINFNFKDYCCGCSSCSNSCPTGAIKMQLNNEGFLYPTINKEECINCNKCEKVCPHLNFNKTSDELSLDPIKENQVYLFFSNSEKRKDSASGGFVYEVMLSCLKEGGMICGCIWNDKMEAVHILSDKIEDLYHMQSSKYVQSNINNCFSEIKSALKSGKKVTFCGTPCQTAGLHFYLNNIDTSNLISICLICHGTASPTIWSKWVKTLENKYNGKLVNVNMRDKSYKGYKTSYSKYTFLSKEPNSLTSYKSIALPTYLGDPYIFLFTHNLFLRRSCYKCKYKAIQNGADIVVGDFHQSITEAKNLGCNSIIAMTPKGDEIINKIGKTNTLIKSSIQVIKQEMLWKSANYNFKREDFLNEAVKSNTLNLFKGYLPLRFYIKRTLNQIGLFNIIKKIME